MQSTKSILETEHILLYTTNNHMIRDDIVTSLQFLIKIFFSKKVYNFKKLFF